MLKFIFGIAIIGFTTFCGYFLAKKYRQKKLFFVQLYDFNEHFLTEIAYYRRPIKEFISLHSYQGEFNVLLNAFYTGLQDGSFTDLAEYTFLTEEEKRWVMDYFLMLGKGDSSSQKAFFSAMKDGLTKYKIEAEENCKRYGDLYIKIGFLCGLLLLILVI